MQEHLDRLRSGLQTTIGLYEHIEGVNKLGDMLTFAPPVEPAQVGTIGLFTIFWDPQDAISEQAYYSVVTAVSASSYRLSSGEPYNHDYGWSTRYEGKLIAVNGTPYNQP